MGLHVADLEIAKLLLDRLFFVISYLHAVSIFFVIIATCVQPESSLLRMLACLKVFEGKCATRVFCLPFRSSLQV